MLAAAEERVSPETLPAAHTATASHGKDES
jgi:hypothetical protein